MYLRTTARRNADGSVVRYLQLAHNEWDAAVGSRTRAVFVKSSGTRVFSSFGVELRAG